MPCATGACGPTGPAAWLTSGDASAVFGNRRLDITQNSATAVLNWRSFDIEAGASVNFTQPSSSATAINRIFQNDPSKIFGSLNANGRVYLINQNGILFGAGSQVNVGGLIASSLNLTPDALQKGIAQAAAGGTAAFAAEAAQPLGAVTVAQGATIQTANGGQVFLFAPDKVANEGKISTPDGQTILAAGRSIFLAASADENLRGILVEVNDGGTVTNGRADGASSRSAADIVGQIIAERGNVTLAGLAVNQLGRVSATTSVRANGSIRLQARDSVDILQVNGAPVLAAREGGVLTVGPDSVSEVTLASNDAQTQVDVNAQLRSTVLMDAAQVSLLENSRVTATSGEVDISARKASESTPSGGGFSPTSDGSTLYIASGAKIDVSGANIELPMERNVLRVELRGSQLADSPEQRNGSLRAQAVYVDIRQSGTRDDGTVWYGTPLADLSGDIGTIGRTIGERSVTGGTVSFLSQGSVLVAPGASIDMSGGSIRYLDGFITTTQLASEGRVVDIGAADPNRSYNIVGGNYSVSHKKWGVTEVFPGFGSTASGHFESGYIEGHDAGSLSVVAPWFAFDGNISASTVRGIHQRTPTLETAGAARSYDHLPLGGKLVFGFADSAATLNSVLGDVRIAPGLTLSALQNANGTPFDPLRDPLPASLGPALIRPELLGTGRAARLAIYSNGSVSMPANVAVDLPAGGLLTAAGSNIDVAGQVDAPSGTISFTARPTITHLGSTSVSLGATATLRATGGWINDGPLQGLGSAALDPLFVNGGTISLIAQQGSLRLGAGGLLDVSGGGWLQANGKLSAGNGGNITLATTPDSTSGATTIPVPLNLGATVRGYSLGKGGTLAITGSEICIAESTCATDSNELWIRPQLLEDSGFGSYALSANRGGLSVNPGTTINLRQRSLEVTGSPALHASTGSILDVTHVTTLDDLRRSPVNLSLSATINTGVDTSAADFVLLPALSVGAGASVLGDPGAKITLTANTRLEVDGTIAAPAGSVSLVLSNSLALSTALDSSGTQFPDSQAIWLGNQARILAPAAPRWQQDDAGRRIGDVLAAGTISLTAQRGYIVTLPGSVVDVSGAAADLAVRSSTDGAFVSRAVASDVGSVSFTAAEGMVLNGGLFGRAAPVAGARGGDLQIVLDPSSRSDRGNPNSLFPTGSRTILLRQQGDPLVVGIGDSVPRDLNGVATVYADDVKRGGFDSLSLIAREVQKRSGGRLDLGNLGTLRIDGEVQVAMTRSLDLGVAIIDGSGGNAHLSAPFVSMGADSRQYQILPTSIVGGDGSLAIDADLIEAYGTLAVQGIADTRLASTGDIRFRGIQTLNTQQLTGALVTGGNITFVGEQLYPTTLSQFSVQAVGVGRSVRFVAAPGVAAAVLSAGGQLTVKAETIEQGGTLRAPFGQIALQGDHVSLVAGSMTSTSGAGLLIPFGQTQGGFDWVYPLLDQQTLVFTQGDDALPQQRIALDSADVRLAKGATIDVSGGGDLLAYEFQPGVTGTRDVLDSVLRPNQYAIVPSLALDYAPYDPLLSRASTLEVGDRVWLDGVGGLQAGFYTLLPARYALLPGAYLVTAQTGFKDVVPGERLASLDGGTVVAGYRTTTGTNQRDSRYTGFEVRPGTDAAKEALYVQSKANAFFPSLATDRQALPRLPVDAGVLSITARGQLALDGSLLATHDAAGRGAAVDITGDRLRVVDALVAAQPGEVLVQASALNNLGAQSLLLGGTRSQQNAGLLLNVAAKTVTIDSGAELRVPELLLAGTDRVDVKSGATLTATAGAGVASDAVLRLLGDGALLRVTSGARASVDRSAVSGVTGILNLDVGSKLSAPNGAVLLDATRDTNFRGDLALGGASLNLASSRINLGVSSAVPSGLVLDPAQISAFDLKELVLTSRSTIDLYGSVDLGVRDLTVHAGGIVNRSGVDAVLSATANLQLANPNGVIVQGSAGSGQLTLTARQITLDTGDFVIGGAANARLIASGSIVAGNAGKTRVFGDFDLLAPLITTESGADRSLIATGALRTGFGSAAASNAVATGLGGSLVLQGKSVVHGGRIDLPAGDVRLLAVGSDPADGVTLAAGSILSVAGNRHEFDTVASYAPGGSVTLAANAGGVTAQSGATVNVSGHVLGGNAGKITITAAHGTVDLDGTWQGGAAAGFRGADLSVDGGALARFDQVIHGLNASGFSGSLEFREHRPADLNLGGSSVSAASVRLTADQGNIYVSNVIDARGPSGGSIELSARDDVGVSGSLLASATAAGGRGGHVLLSSSERGVKLEASALVDVSAGAGLGAESVHLGEVTVRVPRSSVATLLDADTSNDRVALAGNVVGAGKYWLEGVQVYDDADGIIDAASVAPVAGNLLYNDALTFLSNTNAVATALGRSGDNAFKVVPGVEIRSAGDLTLAANWNLYNWHFANDTPGILTLRAGGNLVFRQSLSDGFVSVPDPNSFDPDADPLSFALPNQRRESWSYRFIAGADLASSNAVATLSLADTAPNSGTVQILPGTCCEIVDPFTTPDYRMVRTGTGDILVRAARDFVLGDPTNPSSLDQTAVLYTAGVSGPGIRLAGDFGGLNSLAYPIDAGDVSIGVGGRVRGSLSNQLVTDWLWRVGSVPDAFNAGSPTAWTVNYRNFMQGIGALAGGNVDVVAGGDIENVSLNLPTIGRQVGGLNARDNRVEVIGAGNLRVVAGGSIRGGTYLVGNGSAQLAAHESIGAPLVGQVAGQPGMNPLLGFSGAGSYGLTARHDLTIESAFAATLVRQGFSQQVFDGASFFATYSPSSALDLVSLSGTVLLNNRTTTAERLFEATTSLSAEDGAAMLTYPGTVRAVALDGDVSVPRSMLMFSAEKGNLELFAEDSVILGGQSSALVLTLSDADPASLPSINRPASNLSLLDTLLKSPFSAAQHGAVPIHSLTAQTDGLPDLTPARIVANTGDVFMDIDPQAGLAGVYLAKPARVVAGRDIKNLTLTTEHTSAADVTTVSAGGDITYKVGRNLRGELQPNSGAIVVDGPGALELIAGRTLDLQTSAGITTRGNVVNPALPNEGASVSVLVGLGDQQPRYADFVDKYLRHGAVYDASLLAYVKTLTGESAASKNRALELFESLSPGAQHLFLEAMLFGELRASGRTAAASANSDFARGFIALETLFPGANPDLESGRTSPYQGDINLYFSRLYTLDGGDINLLAPGGNVNAGLATPPTAFGIAKSASQLGIVAQSTGSVSTLVYGDLAVNESRVFAADGGNILVWSTRGDIDAGRGAKTAISAPAPVVSFDANGNVQVTFPAALAGSGIRTLATSDGRKPGDMDLFAPRGVVNAGDAGIVAGNLTIAATAVLGADNISVSGVSVGVPVDTGGFGAALTGASAVGAGATNATDDTVAQSRQEQTSSTPLADQALGFLDVFVTGFGEPCDAANEDCRKNNR